MKKPTIFRNAFTAVLFMAVTAAFAQNNGGAPWKKTVYRTIEFREQENKKKLPLKDAATSSNLAEILYEAVMMGKLNAYWTYDNNLTHLLTSREVHALLGGDKPDTISVTDPVTKIETIKVITRDPNLESFQKFRVLEEWVFNAATGKTDIQILAIAPVKDIFGPDGMFRGVQPLFWIKYTEALPSIVKFDGFHPTGTIAMHIWDDYFMSEVKPEAAK